MASSTCRAARTGAARAAFATAWSAGEGAGASGSSCAAGARWVVARKQRHGDHSVTVELPAVPAGSRAVIVDDIASSGATIAATASVLRARGVRRIDAVVTHAIFAPGARTRIRAAGVRRVASCDTIPHPTNRISVAALIAAALPRSA